MAIPYIENKSYTISLLSRTQLSGLWKQSKWLWNIIHLKPRKTPSRLHMHLLLYLLHWFFTCSVKWIWIGLAFSTNESAWSAMAMSLESCVWPWISRHRPSCHITSTWQETKKCHVGGGKSDNLPRGKMTWSTPSQHSGQLQNAVDKAVDMLIHYKL